MLYYDFEDALATILKPRVHLSQKFMPVRLLREVWACDIETGNIDTLFIYFDNDRPPIEKIIQALSDEILNKYFIPLNQWPNDLREMRNNVET